MGGVVRPRALGCESCDLVALDVPSQRSCFSVVESSHIEVFNVPTCCSSSGYPTRAPRCETEGEMGCRILPWSCVGR